MEGTLVFLHCNVGIDHQCKLFLIDNVPLTPPDDKTPAKVPIDALKKFRDEYKQLMLEKLRAPDGSYEEGLSIPGVDQLPRYTSREAANLQKNNPLGLDEDVRMLCIVCNKWI